MSWRFRNYKYKGNAFLKATGIMSGHCFHSEIERGGFLVNNIIKKMNFGIDEEEYSFGMNILGSFALERRNLLKPF